MEKINKKTLIIILVLAVLVIAGIVCLALFNSGGKKLTEDQLNEVTTISEEYIFTLTEGYPTMYSGIDKLYENDELTYDKLHQNVILNAAIKYASFNLENTISTATLDKLKNTYKYDLNNYSVYDGNKVAEAVKLLFGKDLEIGTVENDNTYGYDFVYLPNENVYLKTKGAAYFATDDSHSVKTKIIESTTKDNKVEIKVAVAYAHKFDNKLVFTSDKDANNIVFESTLDNDAIQDEYIYKFDKYIITFNLDEENNNYAFESVKKVK